MANEPVLSDSARTYREFTERLRSQHSEETAMSLAVGGQFHSFGVLMRQVLVDAGLRNSDYLIDVGCGSGRLSHTLTMERYLGTDVVPDLLAYARSLCPNPSWRFALVNDISIPEADGAADMVCFFSVFTHLLHEDSYRYLLEAHRVLKPGGLFSRRWSTHAPMAPASPIINSSAGTPLSVGPATPDSGSMLSSMAMCRTSL